MNSAQTRKKKISEYQLEDIKELFAETFKKISSKIILIERINQLLLKNINLTKNKQKKTIKNIEFGRININLI